MSDAVKRLSRAVKRAGLKATLDYGRNATHPCTFCGTPPSSGDHHALFDIGRYPNGDTITRPACVDCAPLAEAYQRGLSQTKLLEGLPLPPAVLAQLEELDRYKRFAPRCAQCRKPVEPERFVYVIPTCFACLPPPEPLETIKIERTP